MPPATALSSSVPPPPGLLGLEGLTPPTSRGRSQRLLGEVAVGLGLATAESIEQCVERARANGRILGRQLLEDGILTTDQLARVLAERFGLDHVDLAIFPVDVDAAALIAPAAARRYEALPVHVASDGTILVAIAEPTDVLALDDLAMLTGRTVRPVVVAADDLRRLIDRLAPSADLEDVARHAAAEAPEHQRRASSVQQLEPGADDAPVVRLVDSILLRAVKRGASDVHFDPGTGDMHVHLRVDGQLADAVAVPGSLAPGVVARLKVMASLDIAERRLPQDGRATLSVDGRELDVRVVTLPVVAGEAAVVRVLDPSAAPRNLGDLGVREPELSRLRSALGRTSGGILVTGPTGSGKTTTLYAALAQRRTGTETIITIEDPVEYRLEGVKQMHVNPKAGLTFASGLRSIVRADPDVIMVGEVRDHETARIAVEAALTGHLVLSTLHTRDAPNAVSRLLDMGVEPFLLSSALDCVVAQRLARRLCDECKRPVHVPVSLLRDHGLPADDDVEAFEPVGCKRCDQTGHRGRTGLYEVFVIDEDLRRMILERRTADDLAALAVERGMRRIADHALDEVTAGRISCAEVARVLGRSSV